MKRITEQNLKSIPSKYCGKIQILQKISPRGKSRFYVLHKPSKFRPANILDIPKYYRARTSFDAAEKAAMYLLINYEKYFLS